VDVKVRKNKGIEEAVLDLKRIENKYTCSSCGREVSKKL